MPLQLYLLLDQGAERQYTDGGQWIYEGACQLPGQGLKCTLALGTRMEALFALMPEPHAHILPSLCQSQMLRFES